jgi:hypothetical protein
MADTDAENNVKMTRNQRYHALHREERIAKALEKYHNDPEVIRKKEEREQKKAEREAEKLAEKESKRLEKERARQEKLALALATRKDTSKPKVSG